MLQQLSGITIVLFIACGVLTFILLFIFAKRQIMRFALRSRRGPHVPVGHDAKKNARKGIDHCIEVIPKIVYEPSLLRPGDSTQQIPRHIHRIKAADAVKVLEKEIASYDSSLVRHPSVPLRTFLINFVFGGMLTGPSQKVVQEYCDYYEHARFDPNEFGSDEYEAFNNLQIKLVEVVRTSRFFGAGKKTSPGSHPVKKPKSKKKTSPQLHRDKTGSSEDKTALCVEDGDSKHETTV